MQHFPKENLAFSVNKHQVTVELIKMDSVSQSIRKAFIKEEEHVD